MSNVKKLFGSMVFNDEVMKNRLPKDIYKALKKSIVEDTSLELNVANAIASAMKDWAIEKGVTHYTHWFQPMTGITAEKHDSFISPTDNGGIIMEFSGKELIKGEPDASSFPSGGLRATFEARGYTSWDPTSYAFIKDNTLCIPTAFCSYGGESLDKKTPLMRSMQVINTQALRVLRLLGDEHTSKVEITVGPEQEYFLIDRSHYNQRKDLKYTGRTLFGARPPKGQEMDDHYFGTIKTRVAAYMKELDEELWKLGVLAKTKHNEVAPGQHELAPIFTTTNLATDHNQLTMEMMKKVAERHGLVCLLHEKPFAGLNGSGKHNNWSMCTSEGDNLLYPTKTPAKNTRFLLFLCAIIKAVDDYQDLLRLSVASAGNDLRLGSSEAPPAIVSMFIGDDLLDILECIEKGEAYDQQKKSVMQSGVQVLPRFTKDTSDRNRTSPFAFTGNKFEFRMLGSTVSISGPNFVLNTIVAEVLEQFADHLEKQANLHMAINDLMKRTIKEHKRIIFNGNNYSQEWVQEAQRRGLLNLASAAEAFPYFVHKKNINLFVKHGIFTETEIHSRCEILLENYNKTINIEALTMVDIVKRDILPAVLEYIKDLSQTALSKKQLIPDVVCQPEEELVASLSAGAHSLTNLTRELQAHLAKVQTYSNVEECAAFYHDVILQDMQQIREIADNMEANTPTKYWPFPAYGDILFGV